MTIVTIFIAAVFAAVIWPFIAYTVFDPNVGDRIDAASNLDDQERYGALILAGWTLILLVSGLLLVVV